MPTHAAHALEKDSTASYFFCLLFIIASNTALSKQAVSHRVPPSPACRQCFALQTISRGNTA